MPLYNPKGSLWDPFFRKWALLSSQGLAAKTQQEEREPKSSADDSGARPQKCRDPREAMVTVQEDGDGDVEGGNNTDEGIGHGTFLWVGVHAVYLHTLARSPKNGNPLFQRAPQECTTR